MPALKDIDLKAVKTDLDTLQKRHDALRQAYPPAAKALAEGGGCEEKAEDERPCGPAIDNIPFAALGFRC